MRLALAFCAALAVSPAWADLDERWVRDGADSVFSLDGVAAKIGFQPFRRSIAVVIGVGDYDNGWSLLEAPHHDAVRMRDFFKGQGAFDIVYTLTDGAATRERIRRLMVEELPQEVGPDDRVLFYFSGHGTQRKLFGDRVVGYLVLRNSAKKGYASMIEMGDMERWWLNIAHARQSLFILDACFSGLGLQSKGDSVYERTIEDLSKRGHHLITAGTADQESYASLSKWGGSLFTTALLDGMKGRADSENADTPKDGIVSLKEMWDYVEKRIRAEVPSGKMTPQSAGFEVTSDGEFFFLADPDAVKTIGGDGAEEAKGESTALAIDPREMQLWNDVKDAGDAGLLRHFIDSYPGSVFAPLAQNRLAAALSGDGAVKLTPPEELFGKLSQSDLNRLQEPSSVPLSQERFEKGIEAFELDNKVTTIRMLKLSIAADPSNAAAITVLAMLQAVGDVSGAPNLLEARRLLSSCRDGICKSLLGTLNADETDVAALQALLIEMVALASEVSASGSRSLSGPLDDEISSEQILTRSKEFWSAEFAKPGEIHQEASDNFPEPMIQRLDGDETTSLCGTVPAGALSIYCSADRKIYLDENLLSRLLEGQLAGRKNFLHTYVITREVATHVQNVIRRTAQVDAYRRRTTKENSEKAAVRLDLQAECYAGYSMHNLANLPTEIDVREVIKSTFPATRSALKLRERWFLAGLNGRIDDCDTFSQPYDQL